MIRALAFIILAATLNAAPSRYVARWGGPLVEWYEPSTGYRWTCTYEEFFRYCGGRHPSALGIKVLGALPSPSQRTAPAVAVAAPKPVAKPKPKPKPAPRQIEEEPLPRALDDVTLPAGLPPLLPEWNGNRSVITGQPIPQFEPEPAPEPSPKPEPEEPSILGEIYSLLTGEPVNAKKSPSPTPDIAAMVKRFEGFSAKPYWDNGQWSIGYGTRSSKDAPSITRDEAERRLLAELDRSRADVLTHAAGADLTEKQIAALTSFQYNTGAVARVFEKANGDLSAIPGIMAQWRCSGGKVLSGLVARRSVEGELFASE